MNRLRIALLPALFLCLIALGYAQQPESGQQPDSDKQEETKHPQDAVPPHKPAEASPSRESRPQEEKPPKPEKPEASKPPKDQPKAGQEEHAQGEQGGTAQKDQADTHGKNEKNEKNDKNDKSGRTAHIPDSQFKTKFGHQHSFAVNRVVTETTIVPRQTQFVYEGYTFVFLDPWPAAWMFTDDCYIDYVDDQYFLFDPLHPEIRVALLVAE
jgi:hypothetical protein